MAIKTRPKNPTERNRDHAETPINELSSFSQGERRLTIHFKLKDQVDDNDRVPGLKVKLSDGIMSFKTRGVTADSRKRSKLKAGTQWPINARMHRLLLMNMNASPSTRDFPLFALSFQAVFKTSVRIQS